MDKECWSMDAHQALARIAGLLENLPQPIVNAIMVKRI